MGHFQGENEESAAGVLFRPAERVVTKRGGASVGLGPRDGEEHSQGLTSMSHAVGARRRLGCSNP